MLTTPSTKGERAMRPQNVRTFSPSLTWPWPHRGGQPPAARITGPWNLDALKKVPAATWGTKSGLVQEVYYEGEPLGGKPTRVFAYVARPEKPARQGAGHGPGPRRRRDRLRRMGHALGQAGLCRHRHGPGRLRAQSPAPARRRAAPGRRRQVPQLHRRRSRARCGPTTPWRP